MRNFVRTCVKRISAFSGAWIGARYIYRELIFPFLFAIGVVTFILLVNFLLKSVDRLLGKGLQFSVLIEFLYLNLAWIIAMSVPMAVLVASLMAYGRLAEDNEITAMRASGISFFTVLGPGIVFGTVVAVFMVYFSNNILPDFNHKARLLAGDIYRLRPGLTIEPGYFMDDIPDYSIYVKSKKGELLRQITIYNKNQYDTQTTIYADSGFLAVDGNTILFTLFSGQIHELNLEDMSDYRRIDFKKHRIAIPVDNMMLERRDTARRGDREMNISMMRKEIAKFSEEHKKILYKINKLTMSELGRKAPAKIETLEKIIESEKVKNSQTLSPLVAMQKNAHLNALKNRVKGESGLAFSYQKQINKYNVEIQKKFSIPFACIMFVLIGAPLGVMTRKGGIAVAATLSIAFFLLYYVFLIGGEELADMVIISPFWAMWMPNLLILIIGVYLIYYTSHEQKTMDFRKIFRFFSRKK